MTTPVEVIYFQKPCPHCKEPLFRVKKMYLEWSECRNKKCPYILSQPVTQPLPKRFPDIYNEPIPWQECFNRR